MASKSFKISGLGNEVTCATVATLLASRWRFSNRASRKAKRLITTNTDAKAVLGIKERQNHFRFASAVVRDAVAFSNSTAWRTLAVKLVDTGASGKRPRTRFKAASASQSSRV